MWRQPEGICAVGKYVQEGLFTALGNGSHQSVSVQQIRHIKKHWDPKFKKLRAMKVYPPSKLQFEYMEKRFPKVFTPDVARAQLKRSNIREDLETFDRLPYFSASGMVIEPYQPPDGDGKFSFTKDQAKKELRTKFQLPVKRFLDLRKIAKADENFNKKTFPTEAVQIYVKAHECLSNGDHDNLLRYVTPAIYGVMLKNAERKTIRWKYIQALEPPQLVHAICMKQDELNVYGQITIRIHSEQILAIYDRFGRLMQGSEILRKDVLEYIVFEKNLADGFSTWRMAGKIKPKPIPVADPVLRTFIMEDEGAAEESPMEDQTVDQEIQQESRMQPQT